MAEVIFKYDPIEDRDELHLHLQASKMYFALDDIYNLVRNELKHGDEEISDHIDRLLERIKVEAGMVHDF